MERGLVLSKYFDISLSERYVYLFLASADKVIEARLIKILRTVQSILCQHQSAATLVIITRVATTLIQFTTWSTSLFRIKTKIRIFTTNTRPQQHIDSMYSGRHYQIKYCIFKVETVPTLLTPSTFFLLVLVHEIAERIKVGIQKDRDRNVLNGHDKTLSSLADQSEARQ